MESESEKKEREGEFLPFPFGAFVDAVRIPAYATGTFSPGDVAAVVG